jgi:hypothetical protein
MAKKQTRRSISVSRSTYERLKAFCEANHVSMSQLVETRVNDFLGADGASDVVRPAAPRPPVPSPMPAPSAGPSIGPSIGASFGASFGAPMRPSMPTAPVRPIAAPQPAAAPPAPVPPVPMTSAAARSVVEPPPPIIKPKQETAAPKPAEKRPDQIFTF